jgi:hypothetical protein
VGILDRLGGTGDDDAALGRFAAAFRKERDGMQSLGPTQPELTPEEERAAAMAEPLAHGAVDPTTLLTFDDVEAYTGDRIQDSIIGFSPSFVSVAFNGEAGTYRLASIHGGGRSRRWNVAKTWKQLIDGYKDVTEVDDLGDAAFRTGPFTVVRCGEVIIFAEVLRDDLGPDDLVAMAAVLLRGALTSLPPAARPSS